MTTAVLQKHAHRLETLAKKVSRALLEFEVAQAKWEIAHGNFKVLKTSVDIKRFINKLH